MPQESPKQGDSELQFLRDQIAELQKELEMSKAHSSETNDSEGMISAVSSLQNCKLPLISWNISDYPKLTYTGCCSIEYSG